MPIDFRCPYCGLGTEVDDHYAGQSGPCAGCGKQITVPYAPPTGPAAPPPRRRSRASSSTLLLILGGVAAVAAVLGAGALLVSLLSPAVQVARASAQQSRCASNLQRIAMAMELYHDAYASYPPPYLADDQGRPMHSWRVLLLPYLGADLLYEQYDFDVPWDDPTNIELARQMPEVYGCPADEEATSAGDTSYMVVVGDETLFPPGRAKGHEQLSDGAYGTIMVVESRGKGVSWLDPTDLRLADLSLFINAGDDPAIASLHTGGAQIVCADGQVHFLRDATPADAVRALLTSSGGETLPDDVFD